MYTVHSKHGLKIGFIHSPGEKNQTFWNFRPLTIACISNRCLIVAVFFEIDTLLYVSVFVNYPSVMAQVTITCNRSCQCQWKCT